MSDVVKPCWCGGVVEFNDVLTRYVCLDSEFHEPFSDGRPKKIETLYIAGPMTGYPGSNYSEFHRAEHHLRTMGFKTVNPANFGSDGGHYVDLLRVDLRAMLDCQGVAVLEWWWESTGARNEVQVAGILKMPVRPVAEWIARAHTELSA